MGPNVCMLCNLGKDDLTESVHEDLDGESLSLTMISEFLFMDGLRYVSSTLFFLIKNTQYLEVPLLCS